MPLFSVSLLVAALCIFPGIGLFQETSSSAAEAPFQVIASSDLSFDFTTLPKEGRDQLTDLGFALERVTGDESLLRLSAENGRLNVATSGPALSVLVKKDLHHAQPGILELVWGIERYPRGADWSRGKRQEAMMVVLFFGDPLPGGSFYLPDMPLFLGMFLGEHEPPLKPFVSDNYPDTGRYVCLGNPPPGQTITTRLDLRDAFRDWFGNRDIPPLTGIAIEVDTRDLPAEDAWSSAFIYQISLKKAERQDN